MSWSLPESVPGHAPDDGLVTMRAQMDAFMIPGDLDGVTSETRVVGGTECVVLSPPEPTASVIYLHGGGYRLGHAPSWVGFCAPLARAANAEFFIVDYPLAPEHPFPDALVATAGVCDAVNETTSGSVFVAGDSAGGGLAASLTLAAIDNGKPLPAGLILISPWLDLTLEAESLSTNASTDQFVSLESIQPAADAFVAGRDPKDPLISPLFGIVDEFPPVLIFASRSETLVDDSLAFRVKLEDAGIDVTAYFPEGMQHVWPTLFPELDESKVAVETIIDFIERFSD